MIKLGIDAGNSGVKVVGPHGVLTFTSEIGEYRERRLNNEMGPDDFIWRYEGHSLKKGFAGDLAADEAEYSSSLKGITKAHEDGRLRILLALNRYCVNYEKVYLVTGQTIEGHEPTEKQKITDLLTGRHEIEVNGIEKTFDIERVLIAPEGAAAYWGAAPDGDIKIIDIGSGTVNAASINKRRRFVDKQSFTIGKGVETVKNKNFAAMAREIYTTAQAHGWQAGDVVYLCGGAAEQIAEPLKALFPKSEILTPLYKGNGVVKPLHPVYANAVGFYELAKGAF